MLTGKHRAIASVPTDGANPTKVTPLIVLSGPTNALSTPTTGRFAEMSYYKDRYWKGNS